MKYTIIALILLTTLNISYLNAEPKFSAEEVYPFGAGLFVAAKGGVNTLDSPDGIKNGFLFNGMPDIGAQIYIPFGLESNIGATLDLAYLGFAYKFKEYNNEDNTWNDNLGYFTISPNIHISGFLIGVNFGIPLSAESGNNVAGNEYTYEYPSENMKFFMDIHVGALVPIFKNDFGRLNFYLQGEYPFSVIFKNDLVMNASSTPNFNIQPAALKMGFSYIFNTGLLQK